MDDGADDHYRLYFARLGSDAERWKERTIRIDYRAPAYHPGVSTYLKFPVLTFDAGTRSIREIKFHVRVRSSISPSSTIATNSS